MTLLALEETHTFWQIALGIGLVVVLVVVALLTLLLRLLKDVDVGVQAASATAKDVAGNTAAIEELSTTATVLREIRAEMQIHHDLLSKQ